jgi:hypothetical protein
VGSWRRYEITRPPPPGLALAAWDIGLPVRAEESLAVALGAAMAEFRREGTMAQVFTDRRLTYTPPQTPAVKVAATEPSDAE